MPNHVENDLTVTGKILDIKLFKKAVRSQESILDADKIIPYPENYKKLDEIAKQWELDHPQNPFQNRPKDGFNSGGYEWCVKNWGTKWGFYEVHLSKPENYDGAIKLTYHFQTAWSPAKPVIIKMGELFPTLNFELRYFESGAGYHGLLRIENGVVIDDKRGEYFGERGG
jgi:hypothetical protein